MGRHVLSAEAGVEVVVGGVAIEAEQVLDIITIIVFIALLIRGLLLAGRLVRAVEQIAEKK